jgi:isocitrate lyase
MAAVKTSAEAYLAGKEHNLDKTLESAASKLRAAWETGAALMTYADAVAEVLEARTADGERFDMTVDQWRLFSRDASLYVARQQAAELDLHPHWDCERARRPPRATTRSAAASSTASPSPWPPRPSPTSCGWRPRPPTSPTPACSPRRSTPSIPDKMLAYNLSPSFSWDTTGMTEDEMRAFPEELGKLGFVFNFITYGGHQVDGLASEEFAMALQQDGMLALARLQRKLRLVDSPYRTPQTKVGGPRLDGALVASSGRTATTKAMGKGSTQHQHLVETEVPTACWRTGWARCGAEARHPDRAARRDAPAPRRQRAARAARARPGAGEKLANVIFAASTTGAGGRSSRCATRTPSTPGCARSAS